MVIFNHKGTNCDDMNSCQNLKARYKNVMQLQHGEGGLALGAIRRTSRHLFNNDDDEINSALNTGRADNGGVLRNITNLHTMNHHTANHSGNRSLTSFPILDGKLASNAFYRDGFLKGALKDSSFDHSSSDDDEDDACFDENNARMSINNSSIYEGVDRMKHIN